MKILLSLAALAALAACAAENEVQHAAEPESAAPYLNSDNFDEEVYGSDIPVLVDFTATWCVPCRLVDPIVEELGSEMAGRAKIAKVDIDISPDIYQGLRVNGVPTVLFFNEGVEQDRIGSPQSKETYVRYLETMIAGGSALDASMALLDEDAFRRHFVLTREVETVEQTLERRPDLLARPYENGQTSLSLILNAPSVRQDELAALVLSQAPEILPREFVGLGRCEELKQAIANDAEMASRPDPDGATPLYVALSRSHRLENGGCLRVLLDAGADPSGEQSDGYSLNRSVILQEDVDLLTEFIDRGMNPEATDTNGFNALHHAVIYGQVDSARLLVERGVDVTARTDQGETAADVARDRRQRRMEYLAESDSEEDQARLSKSIEDYDRLVELLEG